MPSLLEMMLTRHNPTAAGLLAAGGQRTAQPSPASQPAPASMPAAGGSPALGGGGGVLDRLFMGGVDPNLSPEQNAEIRRQSMLTAGLATLATGSATQGVLMGRETAQKAWEKAADAAERALAIQNRARIGRAFRPGGEDREVNRQDAERALALALASGEKGLADTLIDYIGTLPEPEKPVHHKPEHVKLEDGTLAVFDPNERAFYGPDGKPLMTLPRKVAAPKDDQLQYVTGVNPETGEPVAGIVNKNRGTFTPIHGVVDPSSLKTGQMSPEQIETAGRATQARANLNIIQEYLGKRLEANPDNPMQGIRFERARFEQTGLLVPAAMRQKLDGETQRFLQAQEAFMLELANQLAGVRGISQDNARGAIYRAFGFEEGDLPGNIKTTLNQMEIGVRSLELQAGSALGLFTHFLEDVEVDEEDESGRVGSRLRGAAGLGG